MAKDRSFHNDGKTRKLRLVETESPDQLNEVKSPFVQLDKRVQIDGLGD